LGAYIQQDFGPSTHLFTKESDLSGLSGIFILSNGGFGIPFYKPKPIHHRTFQVPEMEESSPNIM